MLYNELKNSGIHKEIKFVASKSSGPGGQHVNKVSTRVELKFNINTSEVLSLQNKQRILQILGKQINQKGELIVISQRYRSQLRNKEDAVDKLYLLLYKALKTPKKRIPTKPTARSARKRLEEKRIHAIKKRLRSRNFEE